MKDRRMLLLAPFMLTDGLLGIAALLFFRLDFIVNSTLYQYGLSFNTDWATPYWTTIRLGLALIGVTMILTATSSYMSLRYVLVQADKTTVYVCKSCKTSWCTVNKISKVHHKLPKLKILKSCASCNQKLLD